MEASKGAEGQGPPSPEAAAAAAAANGQNMQFAGYVLISLLSFAVGFAIYQIILLGVRHVRALACMNNEKQAYFKPPVQWFAAIKAHLIYAALFRTRHHRELWLFKGRPLGVLPTRFQSLFIFAVVGMNVALCAVGIDWSQAGSPTVLISLRNRFGTMAVVNMIPLVVMAGRNNPFILALNLSYDTFNLVHRWFGRIVAAEAVAHMVCFSIKDVDFSGGWSSLAAAFRSGSTPTTGLIVSHPLHRGV